MALLRSFDVNHVHSHLPVLKLGGGWPERITNGQGVQPHDNAETASQRSKTQEPGGAIGHNSRGHATLDLEKPRLSYPAQILRARHSLQVALRKRAAQVDLHKRSAQAALHKSARRTIFKAPGMNFGRYCCTGFGTSRHSRFRT